MSAGRAWMVAAYAAALVGGGLAAALAPAGFSPLAVTLLADVVGTVVVFAFSVALRNSSMYDPYWSVAPIAVAVAWWWLLGGGGAAGLLVVAVVSLWGVRLTANFLSGWDGTGHEDWRYRHIRATVGDLLYWPVSLAGIHLFPTVMVFGGLLPVWALLSTPDLRLTPGVLLGLAVSVAATGLEAAADRQLRRFQALRRDGQQILAEGVWSWCRHPNYLGEILFWWGLWLAAAAADPRHLWTGLGAVAITAMFQTISLPLIEGRMRERRERYGDIIRTSRALFPG